MLLRRILSRSTIALLVLTASAFPSARGESGTSLRGTVESGGTGLAAYEVSLYARFVAPSGTTKVLGRATTGPAGEFAIDYQLPPGLPSSLQPMLFVRAESGPAMLVSAIGRAPVAGPVVVNERTTVATGFAFAQFVDGSAIEGNRYGMLNAIRMAANMVSPDTGTVAAVLRLPPNGPETTALRTFNSLANIVASCIATHVGCDDLFDATTVPGGPRPTNVLQAVANIAKYPWLNVAKLFDLSLAQRVYDPALAQDQPPDAWTLFLKFTGSFSSIQDENNLLNGPGAFAIDRKGFLWVNDNYVPQPPDKLACAGMRLLKFYPWGENFLGSPYFGGGLSGAGFGISIAPNGLIWVGNFGFAGTGCPIPPADSVSVFRPDGKPLSPDATGLTAGPISWPQATVPDRQGNIWIANCAADSVTLYPKGRPGKAFEIPIPPPVNASAAKMKTFGIAIDHQGNAWATGSLNSTLAVIGPEGHLIEVIPPQGPHGRTQLRRPMGVASDSRGNIWVANSDFMDVPCPPNVPDLAAATAPSIALFLRHPDRTPHVDSPFTGGGLTIPWLVWAAQELGDPFLRDMAVSHARRHIEFCIRGDGSVCQSASFEPQTGHLIRRYTHKGVCDDSTWTRAQAWAMVGYAVMHLWTREREFLDVATRTADWWLAHAPADRVAFWDFDAPAGPNTPRDTSGTAIAAAALLKLAALAPEESQRARYQAAAEATVTALVERYLDERGILSHGCYNQRINLAIQHELIWGSYYLFEALHVLSGSLPPALV